MKNQRHTIAITALRNNKAETLRLTFNNHKTALEAYRNLPLELSASLPEPERHLIYSDAIEAVNTAKFFFTIGS